ncbi:nucleoprotein [Abu Hammad virus]|uniref:Nucleoprotein n=1 Tax=Abu Hammad virus TaxID=248058 RepID=A0A191KW43_9VIRU|nr:nucleoprotein [Abu Hammad virus]AMT75373.1 nucleoprotein [Abu Hammad virus]
MAEYTYKLDFRSELEWNAWYNEFKGIHPTLNSNLTNFDSFMTELPNAREFIDDMARHREDARALKDSIFGKAVIGLTAHSAPVKECAWLSNKTFVKRALEWFEDNKNKQMVKIWDAEYNKLMTALPTLKQVQSYQDAARQFRVDVPLPKDQAFAVLEGEVLVEYKVGRDVSKTIMDMLVDMERRRSETRSPGASGAANRKETLDNNAAWMNSWLRGRHGILDIPPWGPWDKTSSNGYLIAHTSILKAEQNIEEDLDDLVEERRNDVALLYARPAAELADFDVTVIEQIIKTLETFQDFKRRIRARTGQNAGGFGQQAAALDTVFSSCYWMWKAGVTETSFPALSKFLHELGSRAIGKTKLLSILKSCGWKWGKGLASIISAGDFQGDKIHMHPAVLTSGRLSMDLVLSFGAVPTFNPDLAMEPVGSLRSLLNMETNRGNTCARAIVQLWDVFNAGYRYEDEDIVPPEHMLHQSFLGKISPFQNVSLRKGDALKVKIVT